MVSDDGVCVGGSLVETLAERLGHVPSPCRLRGGKVAEGDAHVWVDGAGIHSINPTTCLVRRFS